MGALPGCAAQQRLKYEQYFGDWRAHGWEIEVSPFLDRKAWDVLYKKGHLAAKVWGALKGYLRRLRDLTRVRDFDLVYVTDDVQDAVDFIVAARETLA